MTDLITKLNSLEGKTPDEIASALKPQKGLINEFTYHITNVDGVLVPGPDLSAFAAAFRNNRGLFGTVGRSRPPERPVSLDRASREY